MPLGGYTNDPSRIERPTLRTWISDKITTNLLTEQFDDLWETIPKAVRDSIRVVRSLIWWSSFDPAVFAAVATPIINGVAWVAHYGAGMEEVPVHLPEFNLSFVVTDRGSLTWGIIYEERSGSQR